jgi:hypothetical protein
MSRHLRLLTTMHSPRRQRRRLNNRANRILRREAQFKADHPWSDPEYRGVMQDIATTGALPMRAPFRFRRGK